MSCRDDLAAAHARIVALEAQLRSVGDPTGASTADELTRLRQENQRLQQELQRVRVEHDRVRERLNTAAVTQAEVTRLRDERDRLVARVQVLQRSRDVVAKPAPAPLPAPRAAPTPTSTTRPSVWEHNRAQPAITRGERAGVWCPTCRLAGQEVEMVRKLGVVKASTNAQYESVTCPRCLFAGLARKPATR